MGLENLIVDKLVELAQRPTHEAIRACEKRLSDQVAERATLRRELDRETAARVAAEPHITEMFKAAQEIMKAKQGSAAYLDAATRLRRALKAAEPHVDQIPF